MSFLSLGENQKFLVALFTLSLGLIGCSEVDFSRKTAAVDDNTSRFGDRVPIGDPVCETTQPVEQKFLFIVDQSGSNAGSDGNDKEDGKPKRAGSIMTFFDKYRNHGEFSWSMITFNNSSAKVRINGFNGDPTKLENAINDFVSESDNGKTPYFAAVSAAKNMIEGDLSQYGSENIIYNVFFLSDGFPTDDSANGQQQPLKPNSPTVGLVEDIAGLKPGFIFFNTAYYALAQNDPDRKAADGLYMMSQKGNGYFIDIPSDFPVDLEVIRVNCDE